MSRRCVGLCKCGSGMVVIISEMYSQKSAVLQNQYGMSVSEQKRRGYYQNKGNIKGSIYISPDKKNDPRLFKFWLSTRDKTDQEIEDVMRVLEDQTMYMLCWPYAQGFTGIVQLKEKSRTGEMQSKNPKMTFGTMSHELFKEKIGVVHRNESIVKESGAYTRYVGHRGGRKAKEIDPNYFAKYWNDRNNDEEALKIRLKRERDQWRPYVYDPTTGIVERNPVRQPEYDATLHSSNLLPSNLLEESDTEIDD